MNLTMTSNPIHHTPLTARMPVIKVMGLGGGGCNAVNRMIELGLHHVDFIAANTDHQALESSLASTKIQLGPRLTRGLGAGGNPQIGEGAAEESYREIGTALQGADMVFLTAGMGGGTGTGSIAIAARVARALGAVTVAIVTTPFSFEMGRRQRNANAGLAQLRPYVDTLITVPNDRLLSAASRDLPMELAFRMADDVLRQGIQGITELITEPGMINVDFAHIRRLMQMGGGSFLSIGIGEGENKARQAIDRALNHPLLELVSIENAGGIIANFTGGSDLTFFEVAEALTYLQEQTGNHAEIIPGVVNNEQMQDRTQAILIITGLGATPIDEALKEVRPARPAEMRTQPSPTPAATPVPLAPPAAQAAAATPQEVPNIEITSAATNLDLPAFMRKRLRYAANAR